MHAGGHSPTLLIFSDQSFCWTSSLSFLLCDTYRLLNDVSSLLVAVHSLSAEIVNQSFRVPEHASNFELSRLRKGKLRMAPQNPQRRQQSNAPTL